MSGPPAPIRELCLAGSRDEWMLAIDVEGNGILWDMHQRQPVLSVSKRQGRVAAGTLTADGTLCLGYADGDIRWIVRGVPNSNRSILGHAAEVSIVRPLHERDLVATGGADGEIRLWRLAAEGPVVIFPEVGWPLSCAVSTAGQLMFGNNLGDVMVIRARVHECAF